MSTIPETRSLDRYRRINVPADTLAQYPGADAFQVRVDDDDVVLTPAPEDVGQAVTEKNRVRLPPAVAEHYDDEEEFAVLPHGDSIVLRPTREINIDI